MKIPGPAGWLSSAVMMCLLLGSTCAIAADPVAGKAASSACSECHEPGDWEGETQPSLESLIRDVVRGSVKHSLKITLTDADIASIAAYWAAASR